MDNYKNHKWAPFEGYYTRVDLSTGASLIMIICTVPKAPERAHNITLVYVSPDGHIWQHEEFPDKMEFHQLADGSGFRFIGFQEGASFSLNAGAETTTLVDKVGDVSYVLTTKNHTQWGKNMTTPESWLNYLPLPLHWHVYSLQSDCSVELSLPAEAQMNPADAHATGIAHLEKNWALSFPAAHIWMQARQPGRGIALAGGKTMYQQAFMMGYRDDAKGIEIDFRPPFAMKVFQIWGPFLSTKIDWEKRTFECDVSDFTQRMVVKASAPKGTFYNLSGPFEDGHRHNWLGQSLRGTVEVQIYKRSWMFGAWQLITTDVFEKTGLEFGGEYYPPRGSNQLRN